ncbi:MAG: diaminopimelate epimerase [Acidobacteria bacterium]|nr:diaminopimelate epimerase [Acidobacteriota bacterium]
MEIDFLKMQGGGDDLVVLDRFPRGNPQGEDEAPADLDVVRLAVRILDRFTGVGGNSLVVLGRGGKERLSARGFDAAGQEAPLSSAGLRCVARYASDSGIVAEGDFRIETAGNAVRVTVIDSVNVRVDMGMPFSPDQAAEIREKPAASFTRGILVGDRSVSYTPVSLGTPRAILFVDHFDFPVARTARRIAAHPDFAEGVGIGFVQVCDRENLRIRTWEAPRREVIAAKGGDCDCAAAAIVASVVHGFTDRECFAQLAGGTVFLQWDEGDNRIYLTGPGLYVFTGTYDFEDAKG